MLIDEGLEILSTEECLGLLEAETLGRVAVSVGALPAVFPVNYRMVRGDVVFLTGEGVKSRAAMHGQVVCFEVDRFDPDRRSGWSVMLVGRARLVDLSGHALDELDLSPWARGDRTKLIRIRAELVSGRRIVADESY